MSTALAKRCSSHSNLVCSHLTYFSYSNLRRLKMLNEWKTVDGTQPMRVRFRQCLSGSKLCIFEHLLFFFVLLFWHPRVNLFEIATVQRKTCASVVFFRLFRCFLYLSLIFLLWLSNRHRSCMQSFFGFVYSQIYLFDFDCCQ